MLYVQIHDGQYLGRAFDGAKHVSDVYRLPSGVVAQTYPGTKDLCREAAPLRCRGRIRGLLDFDVFVAEKITAELVAREYEPEAAKLVVDALAAGCDVFVTVDQILLARREWIEQRFPGFRVRLPSELARELDNGK